MRWLLLLAVLLIVLVKVWPRGLWLFTGLAVLITAGVLYAEHKETRTLEQIQIDVTYAPELCPHDRPLQVSFANTAATPLEKLLFSIHARIPGYSSIVTPYTYRQYESEKILAPGESFSTCYPIPLLSRTPAAQSSPAELEWSAKADRAWFQ